MLSFLASILFSGVLHTEQPAADAPPLSPAVEALYTDLSASGAIVIERVSGKTVFAKQADAESPMASITKLMTALIMVENHDLTEQVLVSDTAAAAKGQKAYIVSGEYYSVGELISALLVRSANDAAIALAEYSSGSQGAFVERMNSRAYQLGLDGTQFANVMGFDHIDQYSTPRDLAWLMVAVLRYPDIRRLMEMRSNTIEDSTGEAISFQHTHQLMHSHKDLEPALDTPKVLAGKTGTTSRAGECLLSLVTNGETEYIVVVLRSADRYSDMDLLLAALSQ